MRRSAPRFIITLGIIVLTLVAVPAATFAAPAQSGPTFVFPSSGQVFSITGSMLFQVKPVSGASGYLWSFVQNGAIVWQNLAWQGHLDGPAYSIAKGSHAKQHMHPGAMQVWVRTWMGGGQWSGSNSVTIQLQGAVAPPIHKQPVTPTHPVPGTVLYQANAQNGEFSKWTGTSDWSHLNGMLVNDGTHGVENTLPSFMRPPYQVQGTSNYAVEAEIQVVSVPTRNDRTGFGIMVRHSSKGDYSGAMAYPCCGAPAEARIYVSNPNAPMLVQQQFDPGTDWHTYRVEVQDNSIRLLVDGNPMVSAMDNRFLTGGGLLLWDDGVQLTVRSYKVIAL